MPAVLKVLIAHAQICRRSHSNIVIPLILLSAHAYGFWQFITLTAYPAEPSVWLLLLWTAQSWLCKINYQVLPLFLFLSALAPLAIYKIVRCVLQEPNARLQNYTGRVWAAQIWLCRRSTRYLIFICPCSWALAIHEIDSTSCRAKRKIAELHGQNVGSPTLALREEPSSTGYLIFICPCTRPLAILQIDSTSCRARC